MEVPKSPPENKDLILREKLAIERTIMASDRTFLSFLRTALYFSIAGMTIDELTGGRFGPFVAYVFWGLALLLLGIGVVRYLGQKLKIRKSRRHMGAHK